MNARSRTRIEALPVPEHARRTTLTRHFGRHIIAVEGCIYGFMLELGSPYSGGHWSFFELGNGGFYMSPPGESYDIHIASNGFDGRMSADAAGITACLFTFSHLSFQYTTDIFTYHFYWLRDFASDHTEAGLIFKATD